VILPRTVEQECQLLAGGIADYQFGTMVVIIFGIEVETGGGSRSDPDSAALGGGAEGEFALKRGDIGQSVCASAATAGELELRSTDSAGRQGTVSVESDGTQVITWGAVEGVSSAWIRLPVAALGPVRPLVQGPEVVARISQVAADALWVEIPGLPVGSADRERIRVPLAAGWTSTRTPADSAPVAAPVSGRPQPWDRARLQLNEKGEVLAVAAEFGLVEGKITRYESSDLTQLNPHNGRLTLDNGLVYEFSFAKDHTHLDLPPLKGLALAYRLPQLAEALKPGLPVRIHYAPPVHPGASRRIVRLKALPH
jgi:hypothetical protein